MALSKEDQNTNYQNAKLVKEELKATVSPKINLQETFKKTQEERDKLKAMKKACKNGSK